MATLTNGLANGDLDHDTDYKPMRFSAIPPQIEIPVSGEPEAEAVELDLEDLMDDPTELCTLLENENVGKFYWITIAMAYAKQRRLDLAVDIVTRGLESLSGGRSNDRLQLCNCLCWLHLMRSREAPRISLGDSDSETPKKEEILRQALTVLNEALKIDPSFPPLLLARGVLCLLRAALAVNSSARNNELRDAAKAFDDCSRLSHNNNMLAFLGKARTVFSMGHYAEAYKTYQQVLQKAPDLIEPDPRIGLGCCLWQLGFKHDAKVAWDRALEINPKSKVALMLIGLYNLHLSYQHQPSHAQFKKYYGKAIATYTQQAYNIDNDMPMAKVLFGGYFLTRKDRAKVEKAAMRAIELTDVNAIISDGWYLRARTAHDADDQAAALEHYQKADQARGGDEQGYLPAKLGAIQLQVLQGDVDGAKFRIEKIIQQNKNCESLALLGALLAEEVFHPSPAATSDEITASAKKAVTVLEAARAQWKDPGKHLQPDAGVLLNLARLHELDNPEKAAQCLKQVESLEVSEFEGKPDDPEEEAMWLAQLREELSPQLLNNIGCFHYQTEKYYEAQDYFQSALSACTKLAEKNVDVDGDALVTTISYNLGRTYEAQEMFHEAKEAYEGVLARHSDYIDARIRLTYIALEKVQTPGRNTAMNQLFESEPNDMEVRSLQGWFVRRAKKRVPDPRLDQEQRHYKHTLQLYDKTDTYSLVAMGNFYLASAREVNPKLDQEKRKEERSKNYGQAITFYEKALQYDPRNAYAAQGIAIILLEDQRDLQGALQIFLKVRETAKDFDVFLNLGHVYSELKQYSRAIESYEAALARTHSKAQAEDGGISERERNDRKNVLPLIARAWLHRGRSEGSTHALKQALDYANQALAIPREEHSYQSRFNVAFVQYALADHLRKQPEQQRSSPDLEDALKGLDTAIETFDALAKKESQSAHRHNLEQRANMGRNTYRKQLERAIQTQREYEEKNQDRLVRARQAREEEMRRREEAQRKREAEEEERRKKIAEERKLMQERDREIAAQREEEERKAREEEEPVLDSEGNVVEKKGKKRKGGKRKKKSEDFINDDEDLGEGREGSVTPAAEGDGEERPRKKKKRKVEKKAKVSKYKSSEFVDSEDDLPGEGEGEGEADGEKMDTAEDGDLFGDEDTPAAGVSKRSKKVVDDEDEDEEVTAAGEADGAMPLDGPLATNGVLEEDDEGE